MLPRCRARRGKHPLRSTRVGGHAPGRSLLSRKASLPRAAVRSRDRFGFLDQHDWNVIAHRILESARAAHQAVLLVIEMQIALAFRAREDVEQFLTQRHRRNPPQTLFLLLSI